MTAISDFKYDQGIPGINNDSRLVQTVILKQGSQHQHGQGIKKHHDALKADDTVSHQGMKNPKEYLGAGRVEGRVVFAVDVRKYSFIPHVFQFIGTRRILVGINPVLLDASVPDIAVHVL